MNSTREELLKRQIDYSFEIEEAIENILIEDIEVFERETKFYLNKVYQKQVDTDFWVFRTPYPQLKIHEYSANEYRNTNVKTVKIQNKEVAKLDFNKLYKKTNR